MGGDEGNSIENVFGGNGDDTITGDEANNILGDGHGSDSLDGGNAGGVSGDDIFRMEPGLNEDGSGDSSDVLTDVNGSDTVDFRFADSGVMIDMDLLDTPMDAFGDIAGNQFVTLSSNPDPALSALSPFENVTGSQFNDLFWVDPLSQNGDNPTAGAPVARFVNGNLPPGGGDPIPPGDTLYVDGQGGLVQQTSLSVSVPGVGSVNYVSIESLIVYNERLTILDDRDGGFDISPEPSSTLSNWEEAAPNFGGDALRGNSTHDPDKFASWTASLSPGSYRVSVSYLADSSLATDARYTIQRRHSSDWSRGNRSNGKPLRFLLRGEWAGRRLASSTRWTARSSWCLATPLPARFMPTRCSWEPVSPGPELTVLMDGQELVTDLGLGVPFDTVINSDLTRLVTIRNDGDAPLEISDLQLVTANPFQFLNPPTTPFTIDPGLSVDIPIEMLADEHGDYFAQVQIVSNDQDENVMTKPGAGPLPPDFDQDPFTFDIFGHVDPVLIIDNGDVGFSLAGEWFGPDGGGFQGDDRWNTSDNDGSTATWDFQNLPLGNYAIAMTWESEMGASVPDARVELFDGPNSLAVVSVNQQVDPSDFADEGAMWLDFGEFDITTGEITVVMTDSSPMPNPLQHSLIADAVRIELLFDTELELLDVANGNTVVPDDVGVIDFGDTEPFSSVQRTFTLSNPAASLDPVTVMEPTTPTGFTLISFDGASPTGALNAVLNPGDSIDLVIQLDAGWPGLLDGKLIIPTDILANNPYDVELIGSVQGTQIIDDSDGAGRWFRGNRHLAWPRNGGFQSDGDLAPRRRDGDLVV